jgi:hypothetical protein
LRVASCETCEYGKVNSALKRLSTQTSHYFTVNVAVFDTPPPVAEIVEVVVVFTFAVFTTNIPKVRPAGIVTVPGTVADPDELVTVTLNPSVGAGELKVIVPVLEAPPLTDVGLKVSDFTVGGSIVNVADSDLVPSLPVIVALV